MTPAELDAIERVHNLTTPGDWQLSIYDGRILTTGDWLLPVPLLRIDGGRDVDAHFAAAAHQWIPALIAEVRRLRGQQ